MAAKIENELEIAVDLHKGTPGQLDVYLEDRLVASKEAGGDLAALRGPDGFPDETLTVLALRDAIMELD